MRGTAHGDRGAGANRGGGGACCRTLGKGAPVPPFLPPSGALRPGANRGDVPPHPLDRLAHRGALNF